MHTGDCPAAAKNGPCPASRGAPSPGPLRARPPLFPARVRVVLYDNPDAFLVCAFKRGNALCEPDPGATAPRQYDCQPGFGNTVRADAHARRLRQRATELDTLAAPAPGPIAKRLKANAAQLPATASAHDTTAPSAEALT